MKIFQSIGIAGIGLLGGSVALAAKKKKLAEKIYGYTRSMATIKRALDLGVIDESFENFSLMIEQCEFVILCAPISINIELAVTIGRKRPKLLFTDVGSTKKTIVDVVEKNFPPGHGFCGSHPMAGSEKRGVEFSDPALFSGKTVILTPVQNADASASETIKKFWQRLDAKVISMDAALHDEICAYTSHFP
ncbi:MAG: prephenate dehydrogenase/arogenate dehydrogenase family protein, partial [bacterium]|nr:prephenate dehydrogenase/arogenate dehydrogenase family protein [bacterium]